MPHGSVACESGTAGARGRDREESFTQLLAMFQASLLAVTGLSIFVWNGVGVRSGQAPARNAGAPSQTALEPTEPIAIPTLHVPLPKQMVTLPSGEEANFEAHQIWKPICAVGQVVQPGELERMVAVHQQLTSQPARVIDNTSSMVGSFNIVFVASGSIPPAAPAALAAIETYIESFFADPITITINMSFQPLSPGVLGGTSSSYGFVNYSPARTQIVGDMDASDTLQTSLPTGTTCPVRYGSGPTVTNETRVFFTFANWKAVDGTVPGADANMTINSNFAFDYDPSNGVGSNFSFQDVVIHEAGHAMGFTSGIDFRVNDIENLDLYRFQRTDGAADYNPDTLAEFTVRPRLMAFNSPNDAHNSDLISVEYRMADGSPYQGSHFREQSPNIGLMDPALAPGETWYPSFYSTADVAMFDVIGYDN